MMIGSVDHHLEDRVMRPTAWVNSLAVFLALAAVANDVSKARAKEARIGIGRHQRAATERLPEWYVKGDWMSTDEDAIKAALDKAQVEVGKYFRAQNPPIESSPDANLIRQKLWKSTSMADHKALEALDAGDNKDNVTEASLDGHKAVVETKHFDGLGDMRRAVVRVEVDPLARSEIEEQERQYQHKERQERATARQSIMVRVLGGLVALLVVIACYLRLEDATKGYYTTLLRVAAVTFVVLVGAGIWLLT
jgi:hypothetical protein